MENQNENQLPAKAASELKGLVRPLADLRVCASCEWIFKLGPCRDPSCPKCGFGSYGARFVYGGKAYRYAKDQHPWFEKKMADYAYRLSQEIRNL